VWAEKRLVDSQFNAASIDFELQAANTFTQNTVVGQATVQLALVRNRRILSSEVGVDRNPRSEGGVDRNFMRIIGELRIAQKLQTACTLDK
jgi:hypothetical protein